MKARARIGATLSRKQIIFKILEPSTLSFDVTATPPASGTRVAHLPLRDGLSALSLLFVLES